MKTSVIEVHDMLSVLSIDEVEKRIGEVPGVLSVTVNFAAANATVRYDETQLEITDVKSAVRQRGYEAAAPAPPAASKAIPAASAAAPTPAGNALKAEAVPAATSKLPAVPPVKPPAAPAPTSGTAKPPEAPATPQHKPDKPVPDKS